MCAMSQCAVSCSPGYVKCMGFSATSHCQTKTWGFEDGTTGGFLSAPGMTVSSSTARPRTGTRSLAIPLSNVDPIKDIEVEMRFCGGGGFQEGYLSSVGRSVSAWFYIDGPPIESNSYFGLRVGIGSVSGSTSPSTTPTTAIVGQWFQVTVSIDQTNSSAYPQFIGFQIVGRLVAASPPWNGTLYVDEIVVE